MEKILAKINHSTLKFLAPLAPEETYKTIVKEASKLVNANYGSLVLKDDEGELITVYSNLPVVLKELPKNSFVYKAFNEKKILVKDVKDLSYLPQIDKIGVKSNIFIPLFYKNESIGVLVVNSSKNEKFTSKESHILKLFASTASLAIRKTQLYSETRRTLETRDLFISMAAHELRTPLTTVDGYVQLLKSKLSGKTSIESRWVEELSWETFRLSQLVNELLAVNRIKTGELKYAWRECSFSSIIDRAIKSFKFTHPDREIEFESNLENYDRDRVIGDADKLLQVTTNVLDNAVKFSPPKSKVSASLRSTDSTLILQIKDLGIGIPKKDLNKIFEGFYQGRGNSNEGMGIGLYLAKNIIRQHKGSIGVYSKINEGTTVEIKLPRSKL